MTDPAAPQRHILQHQRNVTVLMEHAYFGHDAWAAHAPGLPVPGWS